jgi:hypothetical protein
MDKVQNLTIVSWNRSQSLMIPRTEPVLKCWWCATSVIVTTQIFRIMAQARLMFFSLVHVDWCVIILLHCHWLDHFWRWLSICTDVSSAKHHFHVVLEVFDGFLPLVHLQPKQIVSLYSSLLGFIQKVEHPCQLCYSNAATGRSRSKVFIDRVCACVRACVCVGGGEGYSSEPTCRIEDYFVHLCDAVAVL